jgi:hypothetical protein
MYEEPPTMCQVAGFTIETIEPRKHVSTAAGETRGLGNYSDGFAMSPKRGFGPIPGLPFNFLILLDRIPKPNLLNGNSNTPLTTLSNSYFVTGKLAENHISKLPIIP